ncbi:transcription termination factor NusA [Isosphaeraceae bacterium EP7]
MSVDLVRIVDSIHRDKNIPKEVLFDGITSAMVTAAKKHYPDAEDIQITIDPESGVVVFTKDGTKMDPGELGRIAAQTAKQVIIQKIREAERDSLFDEFEEQRGDLVTGTVQRFEGGAVTVNLGKTDALLPRSEQIPGESHHPGERVRAVILDVRKVGQRVKIILSRTHPDFVRRLFELEIPEIADQIISIRALAREAGYRSKVAVSSIDVKVDAVGACVGVRGTRIKNIVDELGGERIDIVRWNESLQVLIPNALQPAEIEEVMLCQLLGRAIVLVREDQLSLAIGRRGQNVRLASKLSGWDIEIMTSDELDELIEKSVAAFTKIEGVSTELAERFVEQGILSYDDLSVMEIDDLVNTIEGLDEEMAVEIVAKAEIMAEESTEDMPRRKGARTSSNVRNEAPPADSPAPSIADLLGDGSNPAPSEPDSDDENRDEAESSLEATDRDESASIDEDSDEDVGADLEGDQADGDMPRDLALATEHLDNDGEVTSPPGESDQGESGRIMIAAVASGSSDDEYLPDSSPDGEDVPLPDDETGSTGSSPSQQDPKRMPRP